VTSFDRRLSAADLAFVAEVTGASHVDRGERLQSLWGGYGALFRVRLTSAEVGTAIVKWVQPPRAARDDVSHARKLRSYEVEAAFYRGWGARCDASCRVAALFGHRRVGDEQLLVLEDLDEAGFPRRERHPLGADLDACLGWLASFHARFLGTRGGGLWEVGTYWHLETRRDELAAIRDPAVRARAPELDRLLRGARHQTILHGDAKPANFCFGRGGRVAAVDFQYTGGGPGIRDVAYLLHGSAPRATEAALDTYFARLREALPQEADGAGVEREWRALFPAAIDDFERFLLGWRG
jgi:hypothetical protein